MKDPVVSGELRDLVAIEDFVTERDSSGQVILERDSFGQDVKLYFKFDEAFARIRTLRGRELVLAQADFAEAQVEIIFRFVQGVVARMRILHDGLYYDILNVNDLERRKRWHILICKTGVADTR